MAESLFRCISIRNKTMDHSQHLFSSIGTSQLNLTSVPFFSPRLPIWCCNYLSWMLSRDFRIKTQTTNKHSQIQMRMAPCWEKLPYTFVWKTVCISLCAHVHSVFTEQMATCDSRKKVNPTGFSSCHHHVQYVLLYATGGGHKHLDNKTNATKNLPSCYSVRLHSNCIIQVLMIFRPPPVCHNMGSEFRILKN